MAELMIPEPLYEVDDMVVRVADNHKSTGQFFFNTYATKRVRRALARHQIPLGFEDRGMTTGLKTLEWDGQSTTILISGGMRGVGKSVLGSLIGMDFMCGKMGLNGFFVDPKWELWSHRNAQMGFNDIFERLQLKPIAHHNLTRVTPACCADMDLGDANGLIHQYDTSQLSLFDLETMMGYGSTSAQQVLPAKARLQFSVVGIDARQQNLTWQQIRDKKAPPLDEFRQRLQDYSSGENDVLLRAFDNLLATGAVGNEGWHDLIKLINQDRTILYQTSLDADLSPILSAYIAKEIRDILRERVVATKVPEKSRLKNPIMFYADEFNTVLPRGKNVSSADPVKRIYGQMRFAGVSILGIAPSFAQINPIAIQQSDYIIAARLLSEEDVRAMGIRGLSLQQRKNLKKLEINKKDIPPAQFALIDADGNIDTFYPLPSLSNFQEEQRYII